MWLVIANNEYADNAVQDLVTTYADLVNYFQILQGLYPEYDVIQPIPDTSAVREPIVILRSTRAHTDSFSIMRLEPVTRPT
jgi:hypothetical protein